MKHEQKLKQALQELDALKEKVQELMNHDKFAELKEEHRNGAVIQVKTSIRGEWRNVYSPVWHYKNEYRIKPEEKPKVGGVVKAWNEESGYVFGIVKQIEYCNKNTIGYTLHGSVTELYMNAKTLTKQEAIELLFGKQTLADDIQELKDKHPNLRFTITVEDNV